MDEELNKQSSDIALGAAMEVHRELSSGLLEDTCRKAQPLTYPQRAQKPLGLPLNSNAPLSIHRPL